VARVGADVSEPGMIVLCRKGTLGRYDDSSVPSRRKIAYRPSP